jgi:hypothetical protein
MRGQYKKEVHCREKANRFHCTGGPTLAFSGRGTNPDGLMNTGSTVVYGEEPTPLVESRLVTD